MLSARFSAPLTSIRSGPISIYVYGRFGAEHFASFAAELDGELVGSNFAPRWGSVGFFGPLSTRTDLWNRGIAQPLVKAVSDAFNEWGISHAGLCTFPQSTKHLWLYQKFGFYPRYLTPIMAAPAPTAIVTDDDRRSRYSGLAPTQRHQAEAAIRELCEELFPGLDLSAEIRTCTLRNHGDTPLRWERDSKLAGFAICRWGPASEAGPGCLYVKSARCGRAPVPMSALPPCSTPVAPWPDLPAWKGCSRVSISHAKRPTN